MRILRVAQKLYPDSKGGGQYHVHALSRDQAAMGHDVTVITTRDSDDLPRREEIDGYSVVRVPKGVTIAGNDVSPWILKEVFARADDYDVVHAHSHLYFATNVAALNRRLRDVPLAITNHGLYSQSAPESVFGLYLKTGARWTFNQADTVFCYTETDKERVQSLGVDSRIEVVPNGVDTDRFTPEGPESELIDHDGPVVLFVGRLVKGKRPEDAIKVLSQLDREDVKLYIVGEGPMRSELEKEADDMVEFLCHVSYKEMPAVYRAGNVLILPSRAEGVPRTVLEAFASGVPVVASDLRQVAPIVKGSGVTVPIGDVEGFVEGIKTILAGGYGEPRGVVEGSFSWSGTVKMTTNKLKVIID